MAGWLKDISIADIIVWFQYPEVADVGTAREISIIWLYISTMRVMSDQISPRVVNN